MQEAWSKPKQNTRKSGMYRETHSEMSTPKSARNPRRNRFADRIHNKTSY